MEQSDQKIVEGDLFTQLDESMKYLSHHLRTQFKIEKVQRENIPEFPEFVLRELLINALIHRDYFERGAEVQVKIFPTALEFSNPGTLLQGTSTREVFGHSIRRNPLLGEIFHRAGYIERAGTGLLRIQAYLKEQRLPALSIEQEGLFFVATLIRPSVLGRDHDHRLNERQLAILSMLTGENRLSSTTYSQKFGITDRQARKDLALLEELDYVRRVKEGRSVYFVRNR